MEIKPGTIVALFLVALAIYILIRVVNFTVH